MSSCIFRFPSVVLNAGKYYIVSRFPMAAVLASLPLAGRYYPNPSQPGYCTSPHQHSSPPFSFLLSRQQPTFSTLFCALSQHSFNHSDHKTLEEIKSNFLVNRGGSDTESISFYYLPIHTSTWINCQEKSTHLMGQRQENKSVPKSDIHLEDCIHDDKGFSK